MPLVQSASKGSLIDRSWDMGTRASHYDSRAWQVSYGNSLFAGLVLLICEVDYLILVTG